MATNLHMNDARYIKGAASFPATPTSGTPVLLGQIPGVALTDEGDGGNAAGEVSIDTGGSYNLTVQGAVTIGAIIYFVTGDGTLTATAGGNTRFGYALAAQSATGVIPVKLGW